MAPRLLTLGLVLLVVVTLSIATREFIAYGTVIERNIEPPQPLETLKDFSPVDLWWLTAGELVTITKNGTQASIDKWDIERSKSERFAFDFEGITKSGTPRGLAHVRERAWANPVGLPFAVSPDGMMMAWVLEGILHIGEMNFKSNELIEKFDINLPKTEKVEGIVFCAEGLVNILYADNSWQLFDYRGSRLLGGSPFKGPVMMWGAGEKLPFSQFDTAEVGVIRTAPGNSFSFSLTPIWASDGTAMALSPEGDLAIGSASGDVTIVENKKQRSYSLQGGGLVRTIAFREKDEVFVAGDFDGIYRIKGDEEPVLMRSVPGPIYLIAMSTEHLALATKDAIQVSRFTLERKVTEQGGFIIGLTSLILGGIALFLEIARRVQVAFGRARN